MVGKISIGPLKIPRLVVMGVEIWPEITLLPRVTVFDPEWIHDILDGKAGWISSIARGVVDDMTTGMIQATFKAVEPHLDKLAEDFYARRGKE